MPQIRDEFAELVKEQRLPRMRDEFAELVKEQRRHSKRTVRRVGVEPCNEPVQVYMPASLGKRLRAEAKRRGCTQSAIVRFAVEGFLDGR